MKEHLAFALLPMWCALDRERATRGQRSVVFVTSISFFDLLDNQQQFHAFTLAFGRKKIGHCICTHVNSAECVIPNYAFCSSQKRPFAKLDLSGPYRPEAIILGCKTGNLCEMIVNPKSCLYFCLVNFGAHILFTTKVKILSLNGHIGPPGLNFVGSWAYNGQHISCRNGTSYLLIKSRRYTKQSYYSELQQFSRAHVSSQNEK